MDLEDAIHRDIQGLYARIRYLNSLVLQNIQTLHRMKEESIKTRKILKSLAGKFKMRPEYPEFEISDFFTEPYESPDLSRLNPVERYAYVISELKTKLHGPR